MSEVEYKEYKYKSTSNYTLKSIVSGDQLIQMDHLCCCAVMGGAIKWSKRGHQPIGILNHKSKNEEEYD